MQAVSVLRKGIQSGRFDRMLSVLYGELSLTAARERYTALADAFSKEFGMRHNSDAAFFSAPGRSEISGNHTDHQHGAVVAAAVSLDFASMAAKKKQNAVTVASSGYRRFQIGLNNLEPHVDERNSTKAFVRGIASYLRQNGYTVGGFDAAICSDVPRGAGLSSSAAYGILLGSIWNGLYNGGMIPFTTLALAAQYAENRYFGKPSGLMDQLASAAGGFVAIDFSDPTAPAVERIDCDLGKIGYAICIVNAGGSHASLTNEYASIPNEMRLVAEYYGVRVLREVDREAFERDLPLLRKCGIPDRAILRSMHFFDENARAVQTRDALKRGDAARFLSLIHASGQSSSMLLQNTCPQNPKERSVSLALAISDRMLSGRGASRVHGGGFAGTIQAIVPLDMLEDYAIYMERVFGAGSCYRLRVRPKGGMMLDID